MNTYAAKLLFQFRVTIDGDCGKRRTCEERITLIKARSAKQALSKAKRSGIKDQFDYKNSDGNPVHFEFVGVMELLHLGLECDPDTVWYDIVDRLLPFERRKKIIPPESKLNAISWESRSARSRN
jgi:hypothetical protein